MRKGSYRIFRVEYWSSKQNTIIWMTKASDWDMIKMEVWGFRVQHTKRKNRERRNTEKNLQQQIGQLMNLLKTDRGKENISKIHRLRTEYYNVIAEYRTKGALIRAGYVGMKMANKTLNMFWIWKKQNIVNQTFQSLKQTRIWISTILNNLRIRENVQ